MTRWSTVGLALLFGHLGFAYFAFGSAGETRFAVELDPEAPLESRVITSEPDRTTITVDGADDRTMRPGVRLLEWAESYRGGFERSVSMPVLVGKRQRPAAPPCSVRVRVGQGLLDDFKGEAPTAAAITKATLEEELRGLSAFPIGDFKRVESLTLEWAEAANVEPKRLLGQITEPLPSAFIGLNAKLVFTRAKLPIFIAFVPEFEAGQLVVRTRVVAQLVGNNRVYRFVIGLLDGDDRATAIASGELQGTITDLLAIPAIELEGGGSIQFAFCKDSKFVARARSYGEVALAVELQNARGDVWPLELSPPPAAEPNPIGSAIQIEADANGLNAILHQLWATEFLDRKLAAAKLEERFNSDPDVERLLSVRARNATLGLPTIEPTGDAFALSAEFGVDIEDGAETTPARLFARTDLQIAGAEIVESAELRDATLSCQPKPGVFEACYSTLAAELTARADSVGEVVQTWLRGALASVFWPRTMSMDGIPARLKLGAHRAESASGRVRIEFEAELVAPKPIE